MLSELLHYYIFWKEIFLGRVRSSCRFDVTLEQVLWPAGNGRHLAWEEEREGSRWPVKRRLERAERRCAGGDWLSSPAAAGPATVLMRSQPAAGWDYKPCSYAVTGTQQDAAGMQLASSRYVESPRATAWLRMDPDGSTSELSVFISA